METVIETFTTDNFKLSVFKNEEEKVFLKVNDTQTELDYNMAQSLSSLFSSVAKELPMNNQSQSQKNTLSISGVKKMIESLIDEVKNGNND